MAEITIAVVALLALAAQATYFFRVIDSEHQAHRVEVRDLVNRLQARSLTDYQAMSNGVAHQPWVPPPDEPRIYDETGLLSVPLEDTLED